MIQPYINEGFTMLSHYLKALRTAHGYRLTDVATKSGLSVPFLSDLEHGRSDPSLKSLIALAAVYEMGAGDLLVDAGYSQRYDRPAERAKLAGMMAIDALQHTLARLRKEDR